MISVRQTAIAIALAVTTAVSAQAQLPTVQQVFDKYATAMGGRDAWAKVTDRAELGSADIAFANIKGSYERYYAAPNKFRLIINLGADIGKVEQGSDGVLVWAAQPGADAAKMPADDAAYVLEMSVTGAAFLDPSRFAKSSVAALEDFDGVSCYKVLLTSKSGRDRIDYFEVATGLRRGQVLKLPIGDQKTTYRDYKVFDGKKAPTSIVQSNAQGDIVITLTTVSFTQNDPKLFTLPAGMGK